MCSRYFIEKMMRRHSRSMCVFGGLRYAVAPEKRGGMVNGGSRRYEIVLIGVLFFTWGIAGLLIWKLVKGAATQRGAPAPPSGSCGLLSILRYRNIWLCCLASIGFMTWLFLMNAFAPLYMTEVARQPPRRPGSFWARVE